jgi:uncharacterized protein
VSQINKLKIFNDPIYGFITIPNPLIYDLVQHSYFQRLRRISQMGLSYLVYPGANHTRFHHALGCMHLMQKAVEVLRFKEVNITAEEENALYIAILLHDIGHGPFSHAMESSIVEDVHHEAISLLLMNQLNIEFKGQLSLAIKVFKGEYHRKFMLQLISSQLDMDRMDYLKRDSFYSGVSEGNVNSERLIQMMNVVDDVLVIEEKGIYSVEKFLMSRRLMYWQVYLHKTSLVAEPLLFFMQNKVTLETFDKETLTLFAKLDDFDIISALKTWESNDDFILSSLSKMIINRDLLKIKLTNDKVPLEELQLQKERFSIQNKISLAESNYFIFKGKIKSQAYSKVAEPIRILNKDKTIEDVVEASDQLNLKSLSKLVTKYYICFPKQLL